MTLVFVYGTLKHGCCNHHYLTGQQFLGEARTAPGFTLYSMGDYPGMVRSTDSSHDATGEVWEVDAVCLGKLNELEGLSEGLYERALIPLAPPFADQPVVTYLFLRSVEGRPALGSVWRE